MAEAIMKEMVHQQGLDEEFYIDSAAVSNEETGNPIYPPAKAVLKEHHIPLPEHYARKVTARDGKLFDRIYVMDSSNMRNIKRILGNKTNAVISRLLKDRDVADPWYTDNFEKAYQDIEEGCRIRLEEILDE